MDELSDEELIVQIQRGAVFAFETLIRRYQVPLFRFVVRTVRDTHDASDVVQESFIRLYKTIDRVDPKKKFSSYMYVIARNAAISHLRQKHPSVSIEDLEIVDDDLSLYEQLARTDDAHRVREAVGQLEGKFKQVIELYYFHDLSYEQIATKLRLPVNTVRTHLSRAKEKLKTMLSYEKH